jgi:hypothetical protein
LILGGGKYAEWLVCEDVETKAHVRNALKYSVEWRKTSFPMVYSIAFDSKLPDV